MKKLLLAVLCVTVIINAVGCSGNGVVQRNDNEQANKQLEEEIAELKKELALQTEQPELEIQDDYQSKIEGNYVYITGSVKNVGNISVSYYKIICKFLDDDLCVLDSTFINSTQELEPGEMRRFEIMHKNDDRFKKYKLSIGEIR
jgi:hypothetical protein